MQEGEEGVCERARRSNILGEEMLGTTSAKLLLNTIYFCAIVVVSND